MIYHILLANILNFDSRFFLEQITRAPTIVADKFSKTSGFIVLVKNRPNKNSFTTTNFEFKITFRNKGLKVKNIKETHTEKHPKIKLNGLRKV